MFPTAHSTVYRNEDGEVTGWDDDYYFEPDYEDVCAWCDQEDDGDDDDDDDEDALGFDVYPEIF